MKGLSSFDEEPAVERAVAAAHAEIAGGGVLGHAAEAGVGDADEDDGLGCGRALVAVGCLAGAPGAAGNVGGAGVDEVLAVVEVEDREAAVGFERRIAGGR